MAQFAGGLLITGTDTGVGKTYVTTLIARQLQQDGVRVGLYKPACSGAEIDATGIAHWPDLDALAAAAVISQIDCLCPYRLREPLAPPVAARREGVVLSNSVMTAGVSWWRERADFVLVEGIGGLLCPLTDAATIADFAAEIEFPLIVVARLGLGTINHVLLTLDAADRRGLDVAGIVLNDALNEGGTLAAETNADELARWISVPILGILPYGGQSLCLSADGMPAKITWQRLGRRNLAANP